MPRLPASSKGLADHRKLNDALASLDGHYDPLGQAWVGAVPSVDVVQSAVAVAAASAVAASPLDCATAGKKLLGFFPSANSWANDLREDTMGQYAEAFQDAYATTLSAIIDRNTCPFKGSFPPTVPELAEVIASENCKAHAIEYRAKKIEEAREEQARRDAEAMTRTPEEVARRKAFAAKVLGKVPTNRKKEPEA